MLSTFSQTKHILYEIVPSRYLPPSPNNFIGILGKWLCSEWENMNVVMIPVKHSMHRMLDGLVCIFIHASSFHPSSQTSARPLRRLCPAALPHAATASLENARNRSSKPYTLTLLPPCSHPNLLCTLLLSFSSVLRHACLK